MSEETKELARRAVASPHWRWMPGMLAWNGGHHVGIQGESLGYKERRLRVCEVCERDILGVNDNGSQYYWSVGLATPDLDDPATLGCLLALVREATGELVFAGFEFRKSCWHVMIPCGRDPMASGTTEAAALVAALEALEAAPEVER